MTHWRMQLHPGEASQAVRYSASSLAAGYIGLGFNGRTGDLSRDLDTLPQVDRVDYREFVEEMREGDRVLIIAHHFPFALSEVAGPYNYTKAPMSHLGIWFPHFRPVRDIRYFADFKTNAKDWPQLKMTDTISPLRDPGSASYRLIEEWLGSIAAKAA